VLNWINRWSRYGLLVQYLTADGGEVVIVVHEPGGVREAAVGGRVEIAAQTLAAINGLSRTLQRALWPAPACTVMLEVGPLLSAGGRARFVPADALATMKVTMTLRPPGEPE
jgi:hypothetical protein